MRLIDADALEKDGWMMHRTVQVDKDTMSYQTKKPTDFPTIEPERKTGKWIECDHEKWSGGTFAYICSECGGAYHLNIEQTIAVWNFCPNCGSYNGGDSDV